MGFLASRHLPVVVEISPWSHLGHAVHTVSQEPDQPIPSDRPALLLVHGFGASTDHWRYNIPVLSQSHPVHAIDLLGFGRSAKPASLRTAVPFGVISSWPMCTSGLGDQR